MSVNEKMTAIADAIRSKTKLSDKLTLDDMAQHAGREWVTGTFVNTPMEVDAIKVVCLTLEGIVNTAMTLGGGGSFMADVEKYTYLFLSRKYDWTIEPADALVGGEDLTDYVDYYWVKGDFTVTCNGIKSPRIYLDRYSSPVDEWGELRPPIIATIYGCTTYDAWVGICDADTTEYTYDTVHDHWGYVQLGGDGTGGVYAELDTSLIPPDGSKVVISRGNLCRNSNSVLIPGNYKLVLFKASLFGADTYEAIAEAPFTLV